MEWGRSLGFKRSASGEALYPRLSELFGQLYFARPSLRVRYTSKTLRDVRLCVVGEVEVVLFPLFSIFALWERPSGVGGLV